MDSLLRYFPNISVQQKLQFSELEKLYRTWNNRINLISRKDIEHFYERHVLHSLSIAKFFEFVTGSTILDVGTGGGFPGIPLAIYFPSVKFTLVDSINKKIFVVNEIIKSLDIVNATAVCTRVESIKEKYDFVMGRAVTEFSKFIKLTTGKIKPNQSNNVSNGIIYLKGGDFENELKTFKQKVVIYNISEIFSERFFETKKIIFYLVEN